VRRPLIAAGALTLGVALTFSACGQQGGLDLARQACEHVNLSLHYYALSGSPGVSASASAQDLDRANLELRKALPLAADANSDDGSWNSLMTTISESATVDELHLAPALKAQCALADTNVNVNPQ
jgi:hypothetical protein